MPKMFNTKNNSDDAYRKNRNIAHICNIYINLHEIKKSTFFYRFSVGISLERQCAIIIERG